MPAAESHHRSETADALSVGRLREEFGRWLRQFGLATDRHNDLVLAVNEALANTAEFAYRHQSEPGSVTLTAACDPSNGSLAVTVTDEGAWREPTDAGNPQLRGRGIPLMEALADEVVIDSSAHGTTVRMRFDRIGDLSSALA